MSDNGTPTNGQQSAGGKRTVRVILAALAAALIAFCVWAMSVYAQGGDPLAWATGSAAFQTTADETDPGYSQDTASSQEAPQTATVTTDDVYAALASLQFDGTDVSLEKDAAHVVLSADGIWVEEASADAPTDMALACAQRSAALATWASEQDVGIPSVTWICEDGSGAVRMAVTMPTDSAPTTGGLATLLSATTGYGISGNAYAQLDTGDVSQFAGTAPTLPDGTAVSIDATVTSAGENLSASDVAARQKDVSSGTVGVTGSGTSTTSGTGASSSGSSSSSSAIGTQSSALQLRRTRRQGSRHRDHRRPRRRGLVQLVRRLAQPRRHGIRRSGGNRCQRQRAQYGHGRLRCCHQRVCREGPGRRERLEVRGQRQLPQLLCRRLHAL